MHYDWQAVINALAGAFGVVLGVVAYLLTPRVYQWFKRKRERPEPPINHLLPPYRNPPFSRRANRHHVKIVTMSGEEFDVEIPVSPELGVSDEEALRMVEEYVDENMKTTSGLAWQHLFSIKSILVEHREKKASQGT